MQAAGIAVVGLVVFMTGWMVGHSGSLRERLQALWETRPVQGLATLVVYLLAFGLCIAFAFGILWSILWVFGRG